MKELPEGWAEATLVDCAENLDGQRVPVNARERAKRPGSVPYYGAAGQVGWIDEPLFCEELLLLGEDGAPFLDKSKSVAYIVNGPSWVNNHVHVLRAREQVTTNHFLKYALDAVDLSPFVSGTTRLKLTQAAMNTIPIALPPRPEQHRIVERVDALMARIACAEDRLSSSGLQLRASKTSLLSAAFTGEIIDNTEHPVEYVPLDALAERLDYGTSAKSSRSGDVVVLRMGNIHDGHIDWEDLVYTSDREEIDKYALVSGDVLFNRTNSPELVGKTAVYRGERPAIHAGYLIRVRCGSNLLPDFLNLCLNSPAGRSWCHSVKTDGVSQSNISAAKLRDFPVPAFSVEKQERIVKAYYELAHIADAAERRVSRAIARTRKLRQAILAKALAGELVPTEAELARREGRTYEPASVLLERAAEARDHHHPTQRKRGGKYMAKRSGRPASTRRSLDEVLRDRGTLTPERLFDLAGFDEASVDRFFEELRTLIAEGKIRERRPNKKNVILEAVGT